MKVVLVKNGKIIPREKGGEYLRRDILIRNGIICKIGEHLEEEGEVIDATGKLISPGFIDIHTHCYPKAFLGLEPDVLGIERGSTTILDAGSSGADNYRDFYENDILKAKTKVFTLLNYSAEGLIHGHELDDPKKISEERLKEICRRYPDNIVGIKARASASVVGPMGITPIKGAAEVAHELGLPLTVHIGNYPPAFTEVLDLLRKSDVATHVFHGKRMGLLNEDGSVIKEALAARKRGVLFDVGHGEESFSLKVYRQALHAGFDCDLISTDLHSKNYNGPVYSLAAVLTKLIELGEPLEEAIDKCTRVPAMVYHLKNLGEIKEGYIGDINIINMVPCKERVTDSIGDTMDIDKKLVVDKTIYSRGEDSGIFENVDRR